MKFPPGSAPSDDRNAPGGETGRGADEIVRGERTKAIVHAARSVQSRLSSLLAAGLMIALGTSALAWYYAHALTRVTRVRREAQTATMSRAQGEMPLPSLGGIDLPTGAAAPAAGSAGLGTRASPSEPAVETPVRQIPTDSTDLTLPASRGTVDVHPAEQTPGEAALARRLSGGVLAGDPVPATQHASAMQMPSTGFAPNLAEGSRTSADFGNAPRQMSDRNSEGLSGLLQAAVTPAVLAELLPTQRFLLPQGSFIDCTLETAIDSTLPGMTACITATDTYGADGKVVLLERGTKLVGETRGQVQQGQARVFVLWTQARTPTGVVVQLASPGADELGRAGLPGVVERHFWERFGAAMLITLIDGAVQAGVQAATHPGGTVVYVPSASQDVLTEVLKETVAIRPTIHKDNGDRIQVLVARDLDFRPVYELHTAPGVR